MPDSSNLFNKSICIQQFLKPFNDHNDTNVLFEIYKLSPLCTYTIISVKYNLCEKELVAKG